MTRYRVKVESFVCVEARNVEQAKARAELALRKVIRNEYTYELMSETDGVAPLFAEGWELFGFNAKKAERIADDD
jgi:hypothetical protein